MYSYIAKSVFNDQLGSSTDRCYIRNRVIKNRVIKRLRCIWQVFVIIWYLDKDENIFIFEIEILFFCKFQIQK